jgi:hypothetical protein
MRGCGWGVFLGSFGLCSGVVAQPVPRAPAPRAESVAPQQHPIRVGDVIRAPRTEPHQARGEEQAGTIRRPGQRASGAPAKPQRWYGWPILITDGTAYGLLALALSDDRTAPYVALPIMGGYLLGGPIVHAANGRWGRAGISLLLRGALPVGGTFLGAASSCGGGEGSDCVSTALSVGVVGMAIATLIDLSVLSWKPIEPPAIEPFLGASKNAAWVGASGSF